MSTPIEITPAIAMTLVAEAQTLSSTKIEALKRERLVLLVDYARKNSKYLRQKYANLPNNFQLSDIPITKRDDAMNNFDDWVCDKEITTEKLNDYLGDIGNATELFLGRYSVLTTSGTTGVPLRMVRDDRHNAVNGALLALRLFGSGKLKGISFAPDMRAAGILSDGGYHSTYVSYLKLKKNYEKMGCAEKFLPLFLDFSTAQMVEKLNDFQPEVLTGYPSNIRRLALEQQKGRLHISPKFVGSSAEYLSRDTREFIEAAFGCPMIDNYCSTEGGEIAMLCGSNHMHINSDWMILEPVNKDMQPVKDGEKSEGALLTNLANLVQPIIRYYISDNIITNSSPCPCGLPFPYLDIEGRNEDTLAFISVSGEEIPLASSGFVGISLHVSGCTQVQFVQTGATSLKIRYIADETKGRKAVGDELIDQCRLLLHREGLANVEICLGDEEPIAGATGKIRNTIRNI